jgi:DNA replication protein DnaC
MLIQPTLDKLNALKLNGMAIALSDQMTHGAAQGLAFEERLALLLDRESLYRENRRMTRLEQLAQFKQRAALEDLNYRDRTGLDRSQIAALAACDWIRANQNVLIHGATGSGKSFLACALGHQACRNGLSVLYVRAPRAVRGNDPMPCGRELSQASRRHRQNQRIDYRRFCNRPHRAARAQ